MIASLIAGFTVGLIGSFHCVGMCGPLALSLPVANQSKSIRIKASVIYNLGRVFTYSLLGGLIGLFGTSMAMVGIQRWISVTAGLMIMAILIYHYFFSKNTRQSFTGYYEKVRGLLGHYYFKKGIFAYWMIGVLNGLLPCGFVYLAFGGAIAAGNVLNSIGFMAGFGMGTFPLMFAVAFMGLHINRIYGNYIRKSYPFMMLLLAIVLLLRGMNLNIPYLSPATTVSNGSIHSCCHK